jgi:hypothetical protein
MGQVIRVSLPGYNALTDTNPDHYALYSDQDWILIKEKARGSISVSSLSTISHNLGYIPFVLVFGQDNTGKWFTVVGTGGLSTKFVASIYIDGQKLYIQNNNGYTANFKYYIFYDQQI